MSFLLLLNRVIDREGKKRSALVVFWFFGIFILMATVYSTFIQIFTFALWLPAVLAATIAVIFLYGKARVVSGRDSRFPTERVTSIFGFDLVREGSGPWIDFEAQKVEERKFGDLKSDTAWSWAALDASKAKPDEAAVTLISAAIWSLLARDAVTLRLREERASLFKGEKVVGMATCLYVEAGPSLETSIDGVWEKRLIAALKKHRERPVPNQAYETPFELRRWVGAAFGNSVGNPARKTLSLTEDEFVAKSWGHRTGFIIKTLIWEPASKRLALWASIENYISSHNTTEIAIAELIRRDVRKALKDSEDSG